MGTTASTKASKGPQPKSQRSETNGLNHKKTGRKDQEVKPDTLETERREYLKKKLRGKILAVAAFRKTVKLSSVPTGEEEAKSSNQCKDFESVEGQSEAHSTKGVQSDVDYAKDLRSLDLLYHPSQNREELRQFLLKTKKENQECWDNINTKDAGEDSAEKFSLRKGSLGGHKAGSGGWQSTQEGASEEIRLPPPMPQFVQGRVNSLVENDIKCDLCQELAAFNMACRICTRVFHRECLDNSGHYNDSDRAFFDQAMTAKGWSCNKCDDLCLLLSPAETAEMMDDFDTCDINRDESISMPEFVRYKKQQYLQLEGRDMPEDEEELLRAQFQRMDTDRSDAVDWWEFVRFEARRYLARKQEEDTVDMLTDKELSQARDVFVAFVEGKEHQSYFQGVYLGYRIKTWQEFLHDQALYILWSRPNREHVIVI